jgi:hypothetical protein
MTVIGPETAPLSQWSAENLCGPESGHVLEDCHLWRAGSAAPSPAFINASAPEAARVFKD